MLDNLTGTQLTNESNSSAGDDGGLGQGESAISSEGSAKTAGSMTEKAYEYTDKIADVTSQAKDYLGDQINTVGSKIKEFATDDLSGLVEKAKDCVRRNPGQAILVSAAAGLLLGLFVRGRRA